jgi:hypothetical protein
MNKIKCLMALISVCIIIAPAISTSYKGPYKADEAWPGNNGMNCNPEVVIIPDGKQMDHAFMKSMMGPDAHMMSGFEHNVKLGDKHHICNCQNVDKKSEYKQMDHPFVKSMMGKDGKQQMCNCQNVDKKSEYKQMDHPFVKSMMGKDGKQQMCNCQNVDKKSEYKQMDHLFVKSMIGKDGKQQIGNNCENADMKSDGKEFNNGSKEVAVIVVE